MRNLHSTGAQSGELRQDLIRQELESRGIIDPAREQSILREIATEVKGEYPAETAMYVVAVVRRYAIRLMKGKSLEPASNYAQRLIDELDEYMPSLEMMEETGQGKPSYERMAQCVQAAGRICEFRSMTDSF